VKWFVINLSHVYIYEGGGIAFQFSTLRKPIEGDRGRNNSGAGKNSVNPDDLRPRSKTKLFVSVENTANRGEVEAVIKMDELQILKEICSEINFKILRWRKTLQCTIVAGIKENLTWISRLFDSISVRSKGARDCGSPCR